MFEIVYDIYVEPNGEQAFIHWLLHQNFEKINSSLPQGIRLLSIGECISAEKNLVVIKMQFSDAAAFERMRQASKVPGFIQEIEQHMLRTKVVKSTLLKKLL